MKTIIIGIALLAGTGTGSDFNRPGYMVSTYDSMDQCVSSMSGIINATYKQYPEAHSGFKCTEVTVRVNGKNS